MRKIRSGAIAQKPVTFDSEAILAFFLGEAGSNQTMNILEKIVDGEAEGYISIINLTEVYYILSRISIEVAEEKKKFFAHTALR